MARIRRPYRGSITVDVDVDVNDLLNDLDDETLIEELELRGKRQATILQKQVDALEEMFNVLRDAIAGRDFDEALAVIDAYQRPRWSSVEACLKDYAKTRPSPAESAERP
jgi:hypothetical protein